jgi:AcrR family transcriptional regulator
MARMTSGRPEREPAQGSSRERLLAGAADMLSRRGAGATSIREVAKHASAPLGSTYHYFPQGKQQLVVEAVRYAGDLATKGLSSALLQGPVEGLRAFLRVWRGIVVGSDFTAGCPVLAAAVEEPAAGVGLAGQEAAAEIFAAWQHVLSESLVAHGVPEANAWRLAITAVAAVEGSVAMCRAQRSAAALDAVAEQLELMLRAELAAVTA